MTLLAKLVAVCRSVALDNDSRELDNDSTALSSEVKALMVNQDLLSRCVPLAFTLNSSMSLADNHDNRGTKYYTREIAERLVYSYFVDVDSVTFSQWTVSLWNGDDWSIVQVLPGL